MQYIVLSACGIGAAWLIGFASGHYESIPIELVALVVAWRLAPDVAGGVWVFAAVVGIPVTAAGVFARTTLRSSSR